MVERMLRDLFVKILEGKWKIKFVKRNNYFDIVYIRIKYFEFLYCIFYIVELF